MSNKFVKVYRNNNNLGQKSNNFNIIRIFLAILVIYSHSFELLLKPAPIILGRSMGNFAVNCFFVISGYFITKSWIRTDSASDFIKKRTLRLLPAYVLAFVLAEILAYIGNNYLICPTPYIKNGSVWTLFYEIAAYFLVLILGMFGLIKSDILGAMWISGLFVVILMYGNASAEYNVLAPLFLNFLGGAYISQNEENIKMKKIGIVCTLILVAIQVFPQSVYFVVQRLPLIYGPMYDCQTFNFILYLFSLPFAIVYIGKYFPVMIEIVGDISYGLYIYAWPVQSIIIYANFLTQGGVHPIVLFIEALPVIIVISVISYIFVERKMNDIFLLYKKFRR